eukprot:Gb_13568 [translate_table: standard]
MKRGLLWSFLDKVEFPSYFCISPCSNSEGSWQPISNPSLGRSLLNRHVEQVQTNFWEKSSPRCPAVLANSMKDDYKLCDCVILRIVTAYVKELSWVDSCCKSVSLGKRMTFLKFMLVDVSDAEILFMGEPLEKELAEQNLMNEVWSKGWEPAKPFLLGSIENWLQCRNVICEEGTMCLDGRKAKDVICGKWRRMLLFGACKVSSLECET